jgi:N-acetylglucosamine kinase-like BadF-type ATPase
MDSQLYLGFDGGATKTDVVALNSKKEVVGEATGNPSNFQVIGVKQASVNIFDLTELVLGKIGSDFSNIKTMYLALAGAGRKDDARKMLGGFVGLLDSKRYPIPKIQVEGDGTAALEGAFGGMPGMVLISGTGSILFAKDEENKIYRVGGWGRLIGDEGSGYALGRSCLAAVARELDGRGSQTMMTRLLCEKMKIENPESMIGEVYQKDFDIASVATVVIEAAEKGDEVAVGIISENVDDLMRHISAILKKMNKPVPLALTGSLLSNENIFSRSFRNKLKEQFPQIEVMEPQFSSAVGAALLAYKMAQS